MKPNPHYLIWIDLEMSGLNPELDKIIEIAAIVTDRQLNIIEEGPALPIFQPETVMGSMDEWNTKQHARSGLIERVRDSKINEMQAETIMLDFIKRLVTENRSPMCGNSICQDRRFMAKYMPKLEAYFHYRNLDVSTVKELAKSWAPEMAKGFKKKSKHLAMADIKESIEELKYYQEQFFRLEKTE